MKRVFDIIFVILAGIIVLPLILIAAIAVVVFLGRPVVFSQFRAGQSGQPFKMIKLRSMSDARDRNGALLGDAERTTAFGRLMRRSRLDELPEFWNILVGDMSLIGPRPLLPETIAMLGERGALRCSVRPGLTGWAQISGNSLLTDTDKLDLDLWYIRNRSVRVDLQILVTTVFVMIFGERRSKRRLSEAHRQNLRTS